GAQADHVHCLVALLGLQSLDVATVGGDHLFRGIARHDRLGSFPALETDAGLAELLRDQLVVVVGLDRVQRIGLGEDAKSAHCRNLLRSSSQASRNSNASRWRMASATSRPQAYRPWPSIR